MYQKQIELDINKDPQSLNKTIFTGRKPWQYVLVTLIVMGSIAIGIVLSNIGKVGLSFVTILFVAPFGYIVMFQKNDMDFFEWLRRQIRRGKGEDVFYDKEETIKELDAIKKGKEKRMLKIKQPSKWDKWAKYKKCDEFRVSAPKSVQNTIEIKSIAENGIFEVGSGGVFTKMYRFSNINYENETFSSRESMLENWCRFLNTNNTPFKITINNKNKSPAQLSQEVFMYPRMDNYDYLREAMNDIFAEKLNQGRTGVDQELYLTLRYELTKSYDEAETFFRNLEVSMKSFFYEFGSSLEPLNASERLKILRDVYRGEYDEEFIFDFKNAIEQHIDFKEVITPGKLDFDVSDRYFVSEYQGTKRYMSCLYLKEYPWKLSEVFLKEINRLDVKTICSIDIAPISSEDATKELNAQYMRINTRIQNQTKRRVKNLDFNTDISYIVKEAEADINYMIKAKNEEDQHFFYTLMNIMVIADNEEDLKQKTESVIMVARNRGVTLDYMYDRQREAFNTILPIGVKQVMSGRTLISRSLTALFPFSSQELFMPGGFFYGTNKNSDNMILADRKKLLNPHGLIFGETGSGKTTVASLEMIQVFLNTNDDIIVIDPKNDYEELCASFNGSYMDINTSTDIRYNPLDFYPSQSRGDVFNEKSEIVLSIIEACKKETLTAAESSIISRALRYAYENAWNNGTMEVTLTDVYWVLKSMEEPEAANISLYMEQFITGPLSIYASASNIDLRTNRVMMFGLQKLGKNLRKVSMLVMLECIKERILRNAEAGIATRLYIDEFRELLDDDQSIEYIKSLWMLVRSLGGIITGMTQNVSDLLKNYKTSAILENTEFFILLRHKDTAKDLLMDNMGLSESLTKYVLTAGAGQGLLRYGNMILATDITIPRKSKIYKMISHSFHE